MVIYFGLGGILGTLFYLPKVQKKQLVPHFEIMFMVLMSLLYREFACLGC